MSVNIDIVYEGELKCLATHRPSGATIVTEAPADNGGTGGSFSPTDLVAGALGTCIMTIMGLVSKRDGIDLTGTKIHVVKEMAKEPERRIAELTVEITFPKGLDLTEPMRKKLERVVEMCPVKRSLNPDTRVSANFVYN